MGDLDGVGHGDPNPDDIDRNRLYGGYRRRVLTYVSKRYPDVSAEDVAQEVMERVLRRRYNDESARHLDPLLYTIATHIVHDLRRRRRLALRVSPDLLAASSPVSPEEYAIDKQDRLLLLRALKELSPADRMLIEFVDIKNGSCIELSIREEISYAALRKRLSRARRRLFARFDQLSRVPLLLPIAFESIRLIRRDVPALVSSTATGLAALSVAVTFGAGMYGSSHGQEFDDATSNRISTAVATGGVWQTRRNDPPGGADVDREDPRVSATLTIQSSSRPPPVLYVDDILPGLAVPTTAVGSKQSSTVAVDTSLGSLVIRKESREIRPLPHLEKVAEGLPHRYPHLTIDQR